MKKMVINPKHKDAPYELAFMAKDNVVFDPHPRRFDSPPSVEVYESGKFFDWVIRNSIPEYIEVEE